MTVLTLVILFKASNYVDLRALEHFSNRLECETALAQRASENSKYQLQPDRMHPTRIIAKYENSTDIYVLKCSEIGKR